MTGKNIPKINLVLVLMFNYPITNCKTKEYTTRSANMDQE